MLGSGEFVVADVSVLVFVVVAENLLDELALLGQKLVNVAGFLASLSLDLINLKTKLWDDFKVLYFLKKSCKSMYLKCLFQHANCIESRESCHSFPALGKFMHAKLHTHAMQNSCMTG